MTTISEVEVVGAGADRPLEAPTRRSHRATWPVIVGVAVIGVAIGFLFEAASVHTFAGNSDGATILLEGQAMSSGALLLHGWTISLDSFWTVDGVFYAIATLFSGLSGVLLHVVPALIATLVVLVAMFLAADSRRGLPALGGAAVVVLLLALPGEQLAFFLLQGPWHVGTVLWCLVAFAGLRTARYRVGFAIAVVALAAGLLGDAVMTTTGVLPVLVAGIVFIIRHRRIRDGLVYVVAAVSSVVLAGLVRIVAAALGAFGLANRNIPVHSAQILQNLRRTPEHLSALFGFGHLPVVVGNGARWIQLVHLVAGVVVLGALVVALGGLVMGLLRGSRKESRQAPFHLDDLLLIAFFGDLATYVLFAPTGNGNYVRYLTPGVVFAAILAGRMVARFLASFEQRVVRRGAAAVALAFAVVFAIGVGDYLAPAAPALPTSALASFLASHHLTLGVGDYWSSSIVTVESGGAIVVRPVTNRGHDELLRYERQSAKSWYAGKAFQFLVFDTAHPWRQVNAKTASAAYGQPLHTYAVGSYRVLVWKHPLVFSSTLPPGPKTSPLRIVWSF